MTLPNHEKYRPEPKDANSFRYEEKWREMPSYLWNQIGSQRQIEFEQKVGFASVATFVSQVLAQLEPLANHRISPDIQAAIKVVVIVAGAFTFGTGMRLITSGLGIWAVPAGLLGGAVISFMVDFLTVKANTNMLKRDFSGQRLNQVDARLLATNPDKPLDIHHYKTRADLVEQMEGDALQWTFPRNAILALILSLIEYSVAVWIVKNVGALTDLPLTVLLIVAALPVLATHGAALAQAAAFELPRYAEELWYRYAIKLFPHPDMSPEEFKQWQLTQSFENGALDAWLDNFVDRAPEEPTPNLARLAFERDFLQDGVNALEAQAQEAERAHLAELELKLEALQDDQSHRFSGDETGLPQREIERYRRKRAAEHDRWLEDQTTQLRKITQRKIELCRRDYEAAVKLWKASLEQAHARYNRLYERWEHDDFDAA